MRASRAPTAQLALRSRIVNGENDSSEPRGSNISPQVQHADQTSKGFSSRARCRTASPTQSVHGDVGPKPASARAPVRASNSIHDSDHTDEDDTLAERKLQAARAREELARKRAALLKRRAARVAEQKQESAGAKTVTSTRTAAAVNTQTQSPSRRHQTASVLSPGQLRKSYSTKPSAFRKMSTENAERAAARAGRSHLRSSAVCIHHITIAFFECVSIRVGVRARFCLSRLCHVPRGACLFDFSSVTPACLTRLLRARHRHL